ncbi:MAG: DUF2227 family putative metal-binding protein [Candidatus Bipolaricaulota bacterium]
MPQGRVHLAFELGTLPAWVVAGAALGVGRTSLAFFAGAYVGASLFLSPDLDLARSDASRRWRAARYLWLPYAALFRHRGISHSPVLGPLTRLLYLSVVGGAAWALLHVAAAVPFPRTFPRDSVFPVLVGVLSPQLLHVVLDRGVTRVRRWR